MQGKATKMIKGMEQLPLQAIREGWDFLWSYSSSRLSGIWLRFIKSWRQCVKQIQNCCFPSPVVSSGHSLKLLESSLKPAKENPVLNTTTCSPFWNLLSQKAVEVHRNQQVKKGESRQIPQQQIHKVTLKWRGRNLLTGIFGAVEGSGGIWGGWTAERQDHELSPNNISYCHRWRRNGLLVWPRRQFSMLSWK